MATALTREEKQRFNDTVRCAKSYEQEGKFAEALAQYRDAALLFPSESLTAKIAYLSSEVRPREALVTREPEADSPLLVAAAAASSNRTQPQAAAAAIAHTSNRADDDEEDDDIVIPTRRGGVGVSSQQHAGGAQSLTLSAALSPVQSPATQPTRLRLHPAAATAGPCTQVGGDGSPAPPASAPSIGTPSAMAHQDTASAAAESTTVIDGFTCFVEGMATLPGGYRLPAMLFHQLYPYQRMGVAWMWSIHGAAPMPLGSLGRDSDAAAAGAPDAPAAVAPARVQLLNGGILADDMGLGKTLQTIAFISGLFHSELVNAVLVGAPLSVVPVWEAEFKKWAPEVTVRLYHGPNGPQRDKALRRVQSRGGVLLTTHDMIRINALALGARADYQDTGEHGAVPWTPIADRTAAPLWDFVILDEGHKIKNPSTGVAKAVRALPSAARLLLTGTPIQNNLDELWALFDFITAGALLGTARSFKREVADRITRARDRHATATERRDGALAADRLMGLISAHLLRREKDKLLAARPGAAAAADQSAAAATSPGGQASTGIDEADALAAAMGGLTLTPGDPAAGAHSQPPPAPAGGLAGVAPSSRPATGAALTGMGAMGLKKEVVLWARVAEGQEALLRAFLDSEAVRVAMSVDKKGILAAITVLQKLASHPVLLPKKWRDAMLSPEQPNAAAVPAFDEGGVDGGGEEDLEGDGEGAEAPSGGGGAASDSDDEGGSGVSGEEDGERAHRGAPAAGAGAGPSAAGGRSRTATLSTAVELSWNPADLPPVPELVSMSGKLRLFVALMGLLEAGGHRTLVFSKSKCMLDVLAAVLGQLHAFRHEQLRREVREGTRDAASLPPPPSRPGVDFLRIDGDVNVKGRRAMVSRFNSDRTVSVCLLTMGVGALGLTLTGADRVIIFDPSWNPAVDAQAVDRAYRVGQTRDVVTYRLVSCGTVEEKMYRLQVFKGGLTSSVMGSCGAGKSSMVPPSPGAPAPSSAPSSSKWATRLLTKSDLKQLFTLGCTTRSETKELVDTLLAAPPAVPSAAIARHLHDLGTGAVASACAGWSSHDHLFRLHEEAPQDVQLLASAVAAGARGARAVAAAIAPGPRFGGTLQRPSVAPPPRGGAAAVPVRDAARLPPPLPPQYGTSRPTAMLVLDACEPEEGAEGTGDDDELPQEVRDSPPTRRTRSSTGLGASEVVDLTTPPSSPHAAAAAHVHAQGELRPPASGMSHLQGGGGGLPSSQALQQPGTPSPSTTCSSSDATVVAAGEDEGGTDARSPIGALAVRLEAVATMAAGCPPPHQVAAPRSSIVQPAVRTPLVDLNGRTAYPDEEVGEGDCGATGGNYCGGLSGLKGGPATSLQARRLIAALDALDGMHIDVASTQVEREQHAQLQVAAMEAGLALGFLR